MLGSCIALPPMEKQCSREQPIDRLLRRSSIAMLLNRLRRANQVNERDAFRSSGEIYCECDFIIVVRASTYC